MGSEMCIRDRPEAPQGVRSHAIDALRHRHVAGARAHHGGAHHAPNPFVASGGEGQGGILVLDQQMSLIHI